MVHPVKCFTRYPNSFAELVKSLASSAKYSAKGLRQFTDAANPAAGSSRYFSKASNESAVAVKWFADDAIVFATLEKYFTGSVGQPTPVPSHFTYLPLVLAELANHFTGDTGDLADRSRFLNATRDVPGMPRKRHYQLLRSVSTGTGRSSMVLFAVSNATSRSGLRDDSLLKIAGGNKFLPHCPALVLNVVKEGSSSKRVT